MLREGFGDVAPGGAEVEEGDFMGSQWVLDLLSGTWGGEVHEGVAQVEGFTFEEWVLLFGREHALDVDFVHG